MKTRDSILTEYCPICGKEFIVTPLHVYKAQDKKHRYQKYNLCSWSCLRNAEKSDRWKIGDKIIK